MRSIDSCSGCGGPYTAYPSAKINKVEDLTLILLSVSLTYLHLLSKKHRFAALFIHSQPFNEMFIFSGKSRCCCDGTSAIYIAASKEYLSRRQTVLDV